MTEKKPQHIAFIMDGNRRWARSHKLSLFFGHENGAKRIEPLVDHAMTKDIKYMTFWAFSTENWQRSPEEVEALMKVFRTALHDPMVKRLQEKKVKVQVLGDLTQFPSDIKKDVLQILEDSKDNKQMTVSIALNYGGREEILQAINELLQSGKTQVNQEEFADHLYTKGMPNPDLIIRTGGEQRTSGYLPWQSVYSELYFTKTLWPDFGPRELDEALTDFANRQRRFGK